MTSIEATSPHAVNVPGAIEAWGEILKAHGTFGRSTARWRPPSATPSTAFRSRRASRPTGRACVAKLGNGPGATRHYLFDGRAPAEGDVIKLPALAATLKAIAKDGPRAFYEGPIAEDMVATLAGARARC